MHANDLADDVDDVHTPKPTRSAETERDKHRSDVLQMVMEIFPGARWTTREAYRRAAATRDGKWRRTRGRVPRQR